MKKGDLKFEKELPFGVVKIEIKNPQCAKAHLRFLTQFCLAKYRDITLAWITHKMLAHFGGVITILFKTNCTVERNDSNYEKKFSLQRKNKRCIWIRKW